MTANRTIQTYNISSNQHSLFKNPGIYVALLGRIICIASMLLLIITLASCGGSSSSDNSGNADTFPFREGEIITTAQAIAGFGQTKGLSTYPGAELADGLYIVLYHDSEEFRNYASSYSICYTDSSMVGDRIDETKRTNDSEYMFALFDEFESMDESNVIALRYVMEETGLVDSPTASTG